MSKKQIINQQRRNAEALHSEISRRAYLTAKPCGGPCGYTLPYPGYPHGCLICIKSCRKPPVDPEKYMKAYIDQQLAQLAMQTI